MTITFQQILPTYFDQQRKERSELWGKELHFEQGEYIKIVAPSGSGKTSLTHFLYGIRHEYTGHILADGRSVQQLSPEEIAAYREKKLSIVLQDLRLFADQTVEKNIELKRQLHPHHPPQKIREMAERLGIGDKLDSLCRTCSYGEQQRVAIIRALMQPFDFLVLDEPFSHLDDNNAQNAMKLMLEESRQRGAGILFADLERVDFFPFTRLYHL